MTKTLTVKAAAGLKFPLEDNAKRYITTEAVEVESSPYYRRALAEGDLVLVMADEQAPTVSDVAEKKKATKGDDNV